MNKNTIQTKLKKKFTGTKNIFNPITKKNLPEKGEASWYDNVSDAAQFAIHSRN
jgi:hypothetical protein